MGTFGLLKFKKNLTFSGRRIENQCDQGTVQTYINKYQEIKERGTRKSILGKFPFKRILSPYCIRDILDGEKRINLFEFIMIYEQTN